MQTFTNALIDIGFERLISDPCMFVHRDNKGEVDVMIVVYVDDAAIGSKLEAVERTKELIATKFSITDLGELTRHLGV